MYIELETTGALVKIEDISSISPIKDNTSQTGCVYFNIILKGGQELEIGCGSPAWFDKEATTENLAQVKRDQIRSVAAFKAINEEFKDFSYVEEGGL